MSKDGPRRRSFPGQRQRLSLASPERKPRRREATDELLKRAVATQSRYRGRRKKAGNSREINKTPQTEVWLERDDTQSGRRECILRVYGDANVGKKMIENRLCSYAQYMKRKISERRFSEFSVGDLRRVNEPTIITVNQQEFELKIVQSSAVESEPLRNHLTIYLVIYSIDDRSAFEWAAQTLYRLSENKDYHQRHLFAILVANKVDLVRSRAVKPLEGKSLAKIYQCAFVEVSAALPLNIDFLWDELTRCICKNQLMEKVPRRRSLIETIYDSGCKVARSCEQLFAKIAAL